MMFRISKRNVLSVVFYFDLRWGTSCPSCNAIGVKWARLVTEQEAQDYGSEARMRLRTALDPSALIPAGERC